MAWVSPLVPDDRHRPSFYKKSASGPYQTIVTSYFFYSNQGEFNAPRQAASGCQPAA
jgi:hypothetical protein